MYVNWNHRSYGLPTYGNYGGKGWSGGKFGGSDFTVKPVDSLDRAFQTHDKSYGIADKLEKTNPLAAKLMRQIADYQLIKDMYAIPDDLLDSESKWYRTLAAGTFIFIIPPARWAPVHPLLWDPLVVDLNGDGIKLTALDGSKVNFDFGADGFKEQTGWVSAQDGLLVLDKNKNGRIDNGTELFGSATQDGFTALAAYDKDAKGKADGKINASDVIFSQLRIWQDKNGNGITDPGELLTLAQAGIREISLTKKASGADNAGNIVDYTGSFTRTNGQTGSVAAISFNVNQTLTQWTPPAGYKPSAEAEKLPVLKGYGRLKDVAAHASLDKNFLKLVEKYVADSATADVAKLLSGFDALLYAWAGVDKLAPDSRGGLVDARKLGFLAAFFNDGFYDSGNVTSQGQADQDNNTYTEIRDSLLTRFLSSVPLSIWLTTGDPTKTYANRFMPLLMLGLTPDNQFSGSFDNALREVFAGTPLSSNAAKSYLDVMHAALNGAKLNYFGNGKEQEYRNTVRNAIISAVGRAEGVKLAMLLKLELEESSTLLVPGNKTIGTDADDLFVWNGGNHTVEERYWLSGGDQLVLTGVSSSQVKLIRSGDDLVLIIAPSAPGKKDGGTITLKDQFVRDYSAGLDQVVFSDGKVWDHATMRNLLLISTTANETFVGTDWDDTFTYTRGGGNDVINERSWKSGEDKLSLKGITSSQVKLSRRGDDLVLTIMPSAPGKTDGGTITLKDQFVNDISSGIDQIVFSDGKVWSQGTMRDMLLTSTPANETFVGTDWDDTFTYTRGGGSDVINERYWKNSDDKLILKGITSSQVKLSRSGDDLVLTIAPSAPGKKDGGTIKLKDQLVRDFSAGIDQIVFSDGKVWGQGTMRDMLLTSTTANETFVGTDWDDTFTYTRGGGNDVINERDWQNGEDKLILKGITSSQVKLSRSGDDLVLTIAPSAPGKKDGGTIKLKDQLVRDFSAGIDQIVFSDGKVWYQNTMRDMLFTSTRANETFVGTEWDDTFTYTRGGGNDVINERVYDNENDKLTLKGIKPSDVKVSRSGNDIILTIAPSGPNKKDGGKITLKDQLVRDGSAGIDLVQFDDGTIWNWEKIAKAAQVAMSALNENQHLQDMKPQNEIFEAGGAGEHRFVYKAEGSGNIDSYDAEPYFLPRQSSGFEERSAGSWIELLAKPTQSIADSLISMNKTVTPKDIPLSSMRVNDVMYQ